MKDFEQRRNDLISPKIGQAFDRPVANVDVGIVDRATQYPRGALLLNTAIAKQSNVPKSVGPRSLLSRPGVRFQTIYRSGGLFQVSGGDINFNGGGADAAASTIQGSHKGGTQPRVELDFSPPSAHGCF